MSTIDFSLSLFLIVQCLSAVALATWIGKVERWMKRTDEILIKLLDENAARDWAERQRR